MSNAVPPDSAMHVCDEGATGGGGGGPLADLRKRKSFDFNLVSEKMKRCRIAGIPGEIRLRKDLSECGDLSDVSYLDNIRILTTADPLVVQVQFEARAPPPSHHHQAGTAKPPRPSFFTIKVPKFYPHEPPVVTVPDASFHGRVPFVSHEGKVTHPLLLPGSWRALGCLKDVVTALAGIRQCESEQHLIAAMQQDQPPPAVTQHHAAGTSANAQGGGYMGMHVC